MKNTKNYFVYTKEKFISMKELVYETMKPYHRKSRFFVTMFHSQVSWIVNSLKIQLSS